MKKLSVKKTASEGIAFGAAYLYREPDLTPSGHRIAEEDVEKEINFFLEAKKWFWKNWKSWPKKMIFSRLI